MDRERVLRALVPIIPDEGTRIEFVGYLERADPRDVEELGRALLEISEERRRRLIVETVWRIVVAPERDERGAARSLTKIVALRGPRLDDLVRQLGRN